MSASPIVIASWAQLTLDILSVTGGILICGDLHLACIHFLKRVVSARHSGYQRVPSYTTRMTLRRTTGSQANNHEKGTSLHETDLYAVLGVYRGLAKKCCS